MANLEAVDTRLSFDDILEAVQDSKRGRWFLQEFESRIQKQSSESVLKAIARLETRMDSLNSQPGTGDELSKVKSAIANARSDLIKLGLGKDELSAEGRLFASLAEMARKTMPVAIDSNAGIVRTLQLVEEIDRTITFPPAEDRGAQYFNADANLFERPAAPAKPMLVKTTELELPAVQAGVVVVAPKEEPAPTGAKLTIRKSSAAPIEQEAIAAPTFAEVAAAENIEVEAIAETEELPAIDNPRIVIIRRKAEDMPEVTLGEGSEPFQRPDKLTSRGSDRWIQCPGAA